MEKAEDVPAGRCVGLHPDWSWCWPINRRVIYNRASVDVYGKPWDEHRWVIRWNQALKDGAGGWEGDVPDGGWPPMVKADGTEDEKTKRPFIMRPEGVACLFATALMDGPFPEHYEPLESPIVNPMSSRQNNPAIKIWEPDLIGTPDEYPIVATTYRVSETLAIRQHDPQYTLVGRVDSGCVYRDVAFVGRGASGRAWRMGSCG